MNTTKPILFIILASNLILFGCSDQVTNTPSQSDNQESTDDFKNRPFHNDITSEIIDSTNDDELLQLVFDNLYENIPEDFSKEYETVISWNKSRQAIYVIWILEGEVNNGGFNQFYYNSSGEFANLLPEALELIGASKFSELLERANSTYKTENDRITALQDGTMEGFMDSYDNNPLDKYDDEFYELYEEENLNDLQIKYIRSHKDDFIK